ncbi:MAG: type I-C CRISPR-associated protein Cas5c [Bacteroidaceae bacterium]|nr:type I-C CRISPR-associated protein Cas5c [Bacteroidaceae bacterium]
MEHFDKEFCLEVWGPLACFTRPEFKVERVSYEVITPSAARAIFESIFWKPAIHWQVTKIEMLKPIKWTNIRRNEVKATAKWSDGTYIPSRQITQLFIEGDNRDQRNTLLLKDVHYRIWAKLEFIPKWKRKNTRNPLIDAEEADLLHRDENPGKYNAMFERRARKGQCFNTPYLGCREFSAYWKFVDTAEEQLEHPLKNTNEGNRDFGLMFYDWDYSKNIQAQFYPALMENGIIVVDKTKVKKL